jgi:hypothetical protein
MYVYQMIFCLIKSTFRINRLSRFVFDLVYWLSTNSRKMLYLRSSYYGSGIFLILKKDFFISMVFELRCCKHLVIHIILVVFVVRHAMNLLMVFHLLLIKNDVYFVYMTIISKIWYFYLIL